MVNRFGWQMERIASLYIKKLKTDKNKKKKGRIQTGIPFFYFLVLLINKQIICFIHWREFDKLKYV